MNKRPMLTILLIGLLTACTTPATEIPASQPTDPPAASTLAPAATDTVTAPAQPESPTATTTASQGVTASFVNDVLPIFETRCANCHGGNRTEEGLNLLTYADLMKGSENGLVVTPGNADESLLVEQVVNLEMPKRGPKLTPDQIQTIIDWINLGALDN